MRYEIKKKKNMLKLTQIENESLKKNQSSLREHQTH